MILALLAFLGGALTIVSPCILPVLPFVFARGGRSFTTSTLPLLLGMALTFAGVALALLTLFGLALLSRRFADWASRPLVAFGNRVVQSGEREGRASVVQSLLLGFATGFLWAPCAGPILGLILTGAALSGPNPRTTAGVQTIARRRRVGAPGPGRRGAARGGRDRPGLGHRCTHAAVPERHQLAGAVAAGKDPSRGRIRARGGDGDVGPGRRRHDDVGQGGRHCLAGRGTDATAERRGRVAELGAADRARSARQGRTDRFLDLLLHQLPA